MTADQLLRARRRFSGYLIPLIKMGGGDPAYLSVPVQVTVQREGQPGTMVMSRLQPDDLIVGADHVVTSNPDV